uniref:Uncharacterized protein n=1 Tax=Anguilla anguilla TaxID=7936 RepID=A0A0E9Q9D6_ANGAN
MYAYHRDRTPHFIEKCRKPLLDQTFTSVKMGFYFCSSSDLFAAEQIRTFHTLHINEERSSVNRMVCCEDTNSIKE